MLGGRSQQLGIAIGSRYLITKNLRVSKGIANGTWVVVRDVLLENPLLPQWQDSLNCHTVSADADLGIVVSLIYKDDETPQQLCAGLAPGEYLITAQQFAFKLKKTKIGLYAVAFPLLPAHAVTGHKVQGQTLSPAIVAHISKTWQDKKVMLKPGWIYVALSRVHQLESLNMTELLKPSMFGARVDLRYELARLKVLHCETAMRLYGESSSWRMEHQLALQYNMNSTCSWHLRSSAGSKCGRNP